jgi:membrane protease YdiL (CAAX protease family)
MKKLINWKLFWILLGASIFANLAVLPIALSLGALLTARLPVPLPVAILLQVFQSGIFFAISIFVGLFLGKKVGLGLPIIEAWLSGESVKSRLKSILKISLILGTLLGISIFILDRFLFAIFIEPVTPFQTQVPKWQLLLASFYGGIAEEIGMRLFLMTLLVWIFYKIKKTGDNKPTIFGVWLAIIIVSIIFGLGHLPMTATFMEITPLVVIRAIILNGIAGVAFGWLYWKKGLESAMLSHFFTDIVLHVILPIF